MENSDIEPTTATITASIPSYNPTNIPVWFSQLNALFSAKKNYIANLKVCIRRGKTSHRRGGRSGRFARPYA